MTEKTIIELINQLFEIEKKQQLHAYDKIDRNVSRIKHLLNDSGYSFHNPTGEIYDETRIDCEATILKDSEPYQISETMKPIIYFKDQNSQIIVQQARVIIS
jgi:hypothetical protein